MMDQLIVEAVEAAFHFGFPTDAGAVLIVELDGAGGRSSTSRRGAVIAGLPRARRARGARRRATRRSARRCGRAASAPSARSAAWRRTTARRTASCRAPRCPTSCARIGAIGARHRLRIANVFHAGDGNIHPILLYDERDADEVRRVDRRRARDPARLRRPRRQHHRRARHRRREDRARCRCSSARRICSSCSSCAPCSIPTQRCNPGQDLPDAGRLRRGDAAAPPGAGVSGARAAERPARPSRRCAPSSAPCGRDGEAVWRFSAAGVRAARASCSRRERRRRSRRGRRAARRPRASCCRPATARTSDIGCAAARATTWRCRRAASTRSSRTMPAT